MGKQCKKCGSLLEDDALFCLECGEKQVEEAILSDSPGKELLSEEQPSTKTQEANRQVQVDNANSVKGKTTIGEQLNLGEFSMICSLISIILLGIFPLLSILAAGLSVYGLVRRRSEKEAEDCGSGLVFSLIPLFMSFF
jgi:hypothetical protein